MKAFKTEEGKTAVLTYYQMLREQIRIPREELTIPTVYGDTFILAAGDKKAPPLILLHGSSMNSAMWIRDIETFSQHFRVYAPDLPGEPGQSSEEQLPFETMDYVYWLNDVFAALAIDQANLAGISLGGWLAARFACHFPEKINKLALLCPAGIGGQNLAFKEIALTLLPKGEEGINELFRMINGDKPLPEVMLNYQKLIAAVFNSRMEVVPLLTDEQLRQLAMPSLLIIGAKDIMLNSSETAARYGQLLPDSQILILPDAGHSLTGLSGQITGFLLP